MNISGNMDTGVSVSNARQMRMNTCLSLSSSLLALLLAVGVTGCGQTSPQAPGARHAAPSMTCVAGGRDPCYLYIPGKPDASTQMVCMPGGRDPCYLYIPKK